MNLEAAVQAAGGPFLFPLLGVSLVVGVTGVHLARAKVLWNPSPALLSAVTRS